MDFKKSIVASVLALALVGCVVVLNGANNEPEDIKYMPSVASITGVDIFGDDDSDSSSSSSSASSSSDDDDSSDLLGSLGGSDDDDSSSSSSSGGSLSDGDNVKVQYKLRLADSGKEVYRQWGDGDGGDFSFELGGGHVIPGFDSAVSGMTVGETKTVTISADQAYGSKGFSAMGIPADADLSYTLKVVSKDD